MDPKAWVHHKADPNTPRIAISRPIHADKRTLLGEVKDILRAVTSSIFYGNAAAYMGLKIINIWVPMPDLFEGNMAEPRLSVLPIAITAGAHYFYRVPRRLDYLATTPVLAACLSSCVPDKPINTNPPSSCMVPSPSRTAV